MKARPEHYVMAAALIIAALYLAIAGLIKLAGVAG